MSCPWSCSLTRSFLCPSVGVLCQRLSLGDEWLDAPLRGGIGEGITEIVGEAACGKTQLAMQLLLQVRDKQRATQTDMRSIPR